MEMRSEDGLNPARWATSRQLNLPTSIFWTKGQESFTGKATAEQTWLDLDSLAMAAICGNGKEVLKMVKR